MIKEKFRNSSNLGNRRIPERFKTRTEMMDQDALNLKN